MTARVSTLHRVIRPILNKGHWHWLRMLALLAMGYVLGHYLERGDWLTQLRYDVYARQLHLQHRGELYPKRTALVLIEDDDYWSPVFEARSPLRRDRLAEMLDKLNAAGANTVVFDLQLRAPDPEHPDVQFATYQPENQKLLEAVGRMCQAGRHVVLAADVAFANDAEPSSDTRVYKVLPAMYTEAQPSLPCLRTGYIELPDDMRRLPGPLMLDKGGHLDSIAMATVAIADPVAYSEIENPDKHGFRFTSFLNAANFAPRAGRRFLFSSKEIREGDPQTLHDELADRIILVGGHWHTFSKGVGGIVDTHNSPGGILPGTMLHANYIEAMLDRTGTYIPLSDRMAEALEVLLVVVLAFIGALDIPGIWKWTAFFAGLLMSVLLTYFLLQNLGVFLDFFVPLLMIVVHTLAEEFLHMRHELHQARHRLHSQAQERTQEHIHDVVHH